MSQPSNAPALKPTCAAAQDALLLGGDTAAMREHRQGCADCQRVAADLEHVTATADAVSRRGLDDVGRARILEQLQRRRKQGHTRAWRPAVWAAAAVLLLAAGGVLLQTLRTRPGIAPSPAPTARAGDRLKLLVPYLLWVSFACGLTFATWRLNPGLLG